MVTLDEDVGLYKGLEHLCETVLPNVCRGGKLIERERLVVIVLQKHRHLICARHKDVLLVEIIGSQLIFGVIPKPRKLPIQMLRLVEFLEAVVR